MCSATVGWVCAPARAGTRSERSNGTARGIGGSGEVAANVGSAAHRAQAGRPRAHAGGVVGPRRGVHRRPCPRLSDVGLAHGRPATRARAPGARRIDRCHARLGPAALVRFAPHAAACGVAVPMMSGRGLGHTGGTLDKLEAIPGFRTGLSLAEAKAQVMKLGCAMIGQTPEIAPADRRLYALRDVTGTVAAIPLIAASIMSKKLAE